jgi:hypothetical protein
MSLYGYGLV